MSANTPPKINPIIQKLSSLFLKLSGWRVEGVPPQRSKVVMIAAPHTSNWDFIFMLTCLGHLGLKVSWMGKDTLFKWPYGWFMRMVGGLPIDRSQRHQVVDQIAQVFDDHDQLLIGILPEGTRKKRDHWKTGFYYIAQKANVPILICPVDYAKKTGSIGPLIEPDTALDEVMEIARQTLDGVQGRYPENMSDIRIK